MKLKHIIFLAAAALMLYGVSCNEVETIDLKTVPPSQQDPALWAAYLAALNTYKASEHYLTYARMDNAPEVSSSPKDFINILPDSLDFIALRRPLSTFDREDLPEVRAKGTKVLAWADCTQVDASQTLEGALSQIAAYDLDGLVVACSAVPDASTVAALTAKIATLAGKTMIFEGDPAILAAADRERYDYFILDMTSADNVFSVREEVDYALERLGIPASKLLLGTSPSDKINDSQLKSRAALAEVARCVMAYGPLAGLAVFVVTEDYYDPNVAYPRTKEAIAMLNPCAK